MNLFHLAKFLAAVTLVPNASHADFKLIHGGRELVGAPIAYDGAYLFATCLGVPIQIPDNTTMTYSSEFSCGYDVHIIPSGWIPPPPNDNNPPCGGSGGARPGINFESAAMNELAKSFSVAIERLAVSSTSADVFARLSDQEVLLTWKYPETGGALIPDSPHIVNTDIFGAILPLDGQISDDCENPRPRPPTGCPGCYDVFRDYVENYENWRELWWENDSVVIQNYYESMKTELGTTSETGQIIGDDYLLKYQFTDDLVNGGIVNFGSSR